MCALVCRSVGRSVVRLVGCEIDTAPLPLPPSPPPLPPLREHGPGRSIPRGSEYTREERAWLGSPETERERDEESRVGKLPIFYVFIFIYFVLFLFSFLAG